MKKIKLESFTICLCIFISIFISSSSWANKNASFDDKLTQADEIRSSNPKQFLILVSELNQQTSVLSNSQQHYLSYLNLYLLIYQGKLNEAIISSKTLLNSDADPLLKFRTQLSLVNIFANDQNWTEGLTYLSNMLNELPLIENKKIRLLALNVTSIFYNQLGQYSLGLSYAKKLESLAGYGRSQCFAKGHIVESYFKLNKLAPDNPIVKQAISICQDNQENLVISFIQSYIARMYIDNEQSEKALQLLTDNLESTIDTRYPRIIAKYYSLIAEAYWLNKEISLTKEFALKSLEYENKGGTTVAKVLSYKLLYEVAQSQRNFELALLYHQKHAIADKLYYDETQAKHLAFQLAEHKSIEQKSKIDLLSKQNALLTAEQALNRANTENTRLIIIVLALTLLVLTFWGYRLLLAHKRIKELAEHDALTSILNRGHFTQIANNALKYCESAGQELSIIMFDLDYFKNINDNYGHACGDWALKKTVDVCKSLGRKNDVFARLGGEEFCILLTSCDKQAALLRAEACREAIADINSDDSGYEFTITASFGVTDTKTSGFDLEKLLADADSAAYSAKHAGRNQTKVFLGKNSTAKIIQLDSSRNAF